jgi:hypothetical protein
MDDTKQKASVYSSERAKTAALDTEPEAATAERRAEAKEIAESLAGRRAGESPEPRHPAQMSTAPEFAKTGESSPIAEFVEFLKRTRRVWLIVAGAIFGLMAVVTAVERVSEWARNSRERRHEQAVASVTPENLVARCGQPAEDVTKDMYPILMRTMLYKSGPNGMLVFSFSRTAEDKSDWVFLSMKDESGTKSYVTPEEKIAAMSCLDSRKK